MAQQETECQDEMNTIASRESRESAQEPRNDLGDSGLYRVSTAEGQPADNTESQQLLARYAEAQPSYDDVSRLESENDRLREINSQKDLALDIVFNQMSDSCKEKFERDFKNAFTLEGFSKLSLEETKRFIKWLVENKPFSDQLDAESMIHVASYNNNYIFS